jgi:hypothetical protein
MSTTSGSDSNLSDSVSTGIGDSLAVFTGGCIISSSDI